MTFFIRLPVILLPCLFFLLLLYPWKPGAQAITTNRDTFTQQNFITGCAKYRARVIGEIEEVLNSLVLLSNSLAATSFHPEAHYRFSELIVKGALPENHEMSTGPFYSLIYKIFAEDKFAADVYLEWIKQNQYVLMELGFLVSLGFLEENPPYKLTTLQPLWQEFSFYGFRDDMAIADIGAGNGFLSFILLESGLRLKFLMTEIDPDFMNLLKAKQEKYRQEVVDAQFNLVEGSKTSLGLGEMKVDCIILREVFHHLQDPYAILQDCKKHLNPGGYLVLREGTRDLFIKKSEGCSKATTYEKIKTILDKSGYSLLQESIVDQSYMLKFQPDH